MIAYLLIAIMILFAGIRVKWGGFVEPFLPRDQTAAINGFFILLVFVGHIGYYFLDRVGYSYATFPDHAYWRALGYFCQLHVTTFLFFSGFGVAERVGQDGAVYVRRMPMSRILSTWLNYAIAVAVFSVANVLLGNDIPVKRMFATLTCFRGVGNPTWYVFCILFCYTATYIGFRLFKNKSMAFWGTVIPIALYHIWAIKFAPHSGWYNTVWAYPAGVVFSLMKDKIVPYVREHYVIVLVSDLLGFFLFYNLPFERFCIRNNIVSILFVTSIVVLSMKLNIKSQFLSWCGARVFPIYIYHTLFFLIARQFVGSCPSAYVAHVVVVTAFICTLGVAWSYRFFGIRLR